MTDMTFDAKRILQLLLLIFVPVGCQIKSVASWPVEQIDLSGYEEKPFSEYFSLNKDNISVLKVDSAPEYRLGIVDRAVFTESKIFLRDAGMKRLVAISRQDGGGLYTVGGFGRAENEFLQVSGYDTDDKGNIWVLDARSRKIKQYDERGNFIRQFALKDTPMDVKSLSGDYFMTYQYPVQTGLNHQLRRYRSAFRAEEDLLPLPPGFDPSGILTSQSFNPADATSFYSCDLFVDDYISLVDMKGEVIHQYKLNFGRYRVPDSIRPSISEHSSELVKYRCVCSPVFVTEAIVGGKLFNKTALSFFVADRTTRSIYIPSAGYEQMTLIYCDDERMSFYVNSYIDDPFIAELCPDVEVSDYIVTLNTTR